MIYLLTAIGLSPGGSSTINATILTYSAQLLVYYQHYSQSSSLWWRCGRPNQLTFSLARRSGDIFNETAGENRQTASSRNFVNKSLNMGIFPVRDVFIQW